jgi:hypothetical protein
LYSVLLLLLLLLLSLLSLGIDAIWLGTGLPRLEMTYEERLGLPIRKKAVNTTDDSNDKHTKKQKKKENKELKRAYYRASLLWHPDKWATMHNMYLLPVTSIFELISEAYTQLAVE